MPRVSRSRPIAVTPDEVWDLVSDPHNMPRWWPRAIRVEDVRGEGKRAQWTTVLDTERGRGVRVDYRCVGSTRPERYTWEQQLSGTPFERILKESALEIRLHSSGAPETEVTLQSTETLRGLSRFGSPMLRRATRRRLDEALDGIERALVGGDHAGE